MAIVFGVSAMPLEVSAECVMVVPTAVFHELGHFQGFSSEVDRYLMPLLKAENISYRPRAEVEGDPSFKQLIPYVIFRFREGTSTRLFQYTRGTGQGEGRLHRKRSVGIGGHISSDDACPSHDEHAYGSRAYEEGMRRELNEEVVVATPFVQQCVGMINDDETDVGRVHLGIVHICDVERPDVSPRESEMIECGFRDVEAIMGEIERFETWSQICLKALFA
ncbi:MAG TPA: phosphoesterase [Pirellulales bacterium]|nr:phosphoesterase [Pirellulales bacterium]